MKGGSKNHTWGDMRVSFAVVSGRSAVIVEEENSLTRERDSYVDEGEISVENEEQGPN
jgi:hypothetical protein